jgi:hypothetical protein
VAIACCALVVFVLGTVAAVSASNASRARQIHDNFLGKTFYGKQVDTNEYGTSASQKGAEAVSESTKTYYLHFNENGTVDYEWSTGMEFTKYFEDYENITAPDPIESGNSGQVDGFTIEISPTGEVRIKTSGNGSGDVVILDKDDQPLAIEDYAGIDLHLNNYR